MHKHEFKVLRSSKTTLIFECHLCKIIAQVGRLTWNYAVMSEHAGYMAYLDTYGKVSKGGSDG